MDWPCASSTCALERQIAKLEETTVIPMCEMYCAGAEQAVQAAQAVHAAQAVEATDACAVEATDTAQAAQAAQAVEATDTAQAVQAVQAVEVMDTAQAAQAAQAVECVDGLVMCKHTSRAFARRGPNFWKDRLVHSKSLNMRQIVERNMQKIEHSLRRESNSQHQV